MILVDTSVWADHLRKGSRELSELLNDGKQFAKARRNDERTVSRIGVGYAAIAGVCAASKPVSRREMLRMTLGASAVAALTPGLGLGIISEVLVQSEITAFKQAAHQLAQLGRERLALAENA